MSAFAVEARAAGSGLVRLVRAEPSWAAEFAFTTGGFLRSFAAPVAVLPLYVAAVALVDRGASVQALESAGAAHLIDAFGFPLLLAAIAGPLRFKAGFAAFVTVNNWAALYLNIALALCALLALLGPAGIEAFSWISLLLLCLSVLIVWRIARETLSHELAAVVLVVVLSVAWSAFADEVARRLLG